MHQHPGFLLPCAVLLTAFGCMHSRVLESLNAHWADSKDIQSPATGDADADAVAGLDTTDRTSPAGVAEGTSIFGSAGMIDVAPVSDDSGQAPREIPGNTREADDSPLKRRLRSEYVGLTLDEAKALAETQNRQFRTRFVDGKGGVLTADLCPGRVTAIIENGVVHSISVEEMKRVRVDGSSQTTPARPAEN